MSRDDPGVGEDVREDQERGSDATRIALRIEEWRRTGDLGRLWPDVAPADLRAAHRQVRAVTEAALEAVPTVERAALAGGGARERRALGVAAFQSGMGPLLAWWIREGLVEASAEATEVLAPHLEHGRRRIHMLREQLVRVVEAMRSRGIDPVVLKGLHTGAEYFPHPGTRPAADIDLLVRPHERPGAAAALKAAGLTESRRTGFAARSEWVPADSRRTVQSLELEHADDPWSVDLHTSLERWYFRGLRRDLGEGWSGRTAEVPVGATTVRGLGQPDLTAFLALHASHELAKVRLVRIVELVLVLRADRESGRLDGSELEALVRRTGTGRFVHPALALAEALAPGTVEPGLLAQTGRRMTARARRVLAAVKHADMAPLTRPSLDGKLMWARGPRQLLLNLSEVVVPSDEGLDVGWARLQWRRLAALLRGGAGWRAVRDADTLSDPSSSDPAPALPPAVRAFDHTAPRFDERFGEWRSVAAQRRAVRRYLLRTFAPGHRLLELGAGTGEDALFLLERGYDVTVTDGSPTMVERAAEKLREAGFGDRPTPEQVVLEELDRFADRHLEAGRPPWDGAYSNFAALNCVEDLSSLARPLARLLRPGARCLLVVFGPCPPGEVVVELLRGRPKAAVRRFRRGPAPARLGGEHFQVWYPSPWTVASALAPWFRLRRIRGVGILVPPSAAEPFISRFPRLVTALEAADRLLAAPLALLGDHVLLDLERTDE